MAIEPVWNLAQEPDAGFPPVRRDRLNPDRARSRCFISTFPSTGEFGLAKTSR